MTGYRLEENKIKRLREISSRESEVKFLGKNLPLYLGEHKVNDKHMLCTWNGGLSSEDLNWGNKELCNL